MIWLAERFLVVVSAILLIGAIAYAVTPAPRPKQVVEAVILNGVEVQPSEIPEGATVVKVVDDKGRVTISLTWVELLPPPK